MGKDIESLEDIMENIAKNHDHWMRNAEWEGAIAEGRERALEKGMEKKCREVIKALLDESSFSLERIAEVLKVPLEMVKEVKNEAGIS